MKTSSLSLFFDIIFISKLKKKFFAAMEGLYFDRIGGIEKSRTDWKIKARVTRMWPTVSPESGTVKGFNIILLDDDVQHMFYVSLFSFELL